MQHGIPSSPEGDGAPTKKNASMSNMAKLSNRAAETLDVLAGGGRPVWKSWRGWPAWRCHPTKLPARGGYTYALLSLFYGAYKYQYHCW